MQIGVIPFRPLLHSLIACLFAHRVGQFLDEPKPLFVSMPTTAAGQQRLSQLLGD